MIVAAQRFPILIGVGAWIGRCSVDHPATDIERLFSVS
ncbi:hypothetical protein ACVIKP_005380 [Rhizobium leguminosarum]